MTQIDRLRRSVAVEIQKLRAGTPETFTDHVATEEPLEIRLVASDGTFTRISVTMRTPGDDFELAVGFLFTEGILTARDSVKAIAFAEASGDQAGNIVNVCVDDSVDLDPARFQRNFYTTSSCGVCGKGSLEALVIQGCAPPRGSGPLVNASTILRLPAALRQAQSVFEETGGLHAAGLFDDEGNLLGLREDVGRHNALDKLIGKCFLAGELPLSDRVLLVSGRTSFELLQKAAMSGIPFVAGVGAPSSLAVDTARAFGITLVGFLRRDGFNIYAGAARVQMDL
ncbi:MAG TPA: formate dehydrogenase accessory sulfurtransferase FdhD [Chloroflexota bacterium]